MKPYEIEIEQEENSVKELLDQYMHEDGTPKPKSKNINDDEEQQAIKQVQDEEPPLSIKTFDWYTPETMSISKNKLNHFFDERFNLIFQDNIANIGNTLRLFVNGYWRVVQEGTIKQYIFEYFRRCGVSLDIRNHVNELTKRTLEHAKSIHVPTDNTGLYRQRIAIPFTNGTLYIYPETGNREFKQEHRKEDYCLYQVQEPFSEDLFIMDFDSSFIGQYFKEYFSDQARRFLQMFLASILIPTFKHEKAMYLVSLNRGRSGKGTLTDTIIDLLNDEAVSLVEMEDIGKNHLNDDLANSILNVGAEINNRSKQNQKALKRVISCDPMQFKSIYEAPFKARPLAKHVFTANSYPNVDIDHALMQRIVFLKQIKTPEKPDPKFKEQFAANKRYLLSFILAGIYELIDSDFILPEGDNVTAEWFEANETITDFFNEYIGVDPEFTCLSTEAYRVYEDWFDRNLKGTNTARLGDSGFTKKINKVLGSQYDFIRKHNNERVFDETANKNAYVWHGFRIVDEKTRKGKLDLVDMTK